MANETSLGDAVLSASFAGTLIASFLAIMGIALGSYLSYRYQRLHALEAENRRRQQDALAEISGIIPLLRHLMISRGRAYAQHHWRRRQAEEATTTERRAKLDHDMTETREKAEELLTEIMKMRAELHRTLAHAAYAFDVEEIVAQIQKIRTLRWLQPGDVEGAKTANSNEDIHAFEKEYANSLRSIFDELERLQLLMEMRLRS